MRPSASETELISRILSGDVFCLIEYQEIKARSQDARRCQALADLERNLQDMGAGKIRRASECDACWESVFNGENIWRLGRGNQQCLAKK